MQTNLYKQLVIVFQYEPNTTRCSVLLEQREIFIYNPRIEQVVRERITNLPTFFGVQKPLKYITVNADFTVVPAK